MSTSSLARSPAPTNFRRLLAAGALALPCLTGCPDRGAAVPRDPGAPATPVVVATAALREVPMALEAPGTLQAINSVALRARVDGEIVGVGFEEGTEVKTGQLLFRIDPRPLEAALDAARAGLARDEALLARNRAQLQRYQDLAAKGYVSADDYAQITANQRVAEAALAGDRAAVHAAEINLEYCSIRAPIAGRTGVIALRKGALVKAADNVTLTTITQMNPLFVDFSVPQRYLNALGRGRAARISLGTATGGPDRPAVLEFIDNAVDPATGTIRLRARTANADRALWPGEFAQLRLELGGEPPALTVPGAAIGDGPDGSYVFVVDRDSHARQRPVTVTRLEGDVAVLAAGIAAGDRVVVDGQSRLRDGAAVQMLMPGTGP